MRRQAARREAGRLAFGDGGARATRLREAAARGLLRELAESWDTWYACFYRADRPGSPADRLCRAQARAAAARLAPLARGGAVLDVGCGDGALVRALAGVCREAHGVDVSARALSHARRRCREVPNARVRLLRRWRLPYPDAAFDAVVCRRTLSHLDVEAALLLLREAGRVLRPGGRLAFDLPNLYHGPYLRALAAPGTGNWPALSRARYWTPGMVRALLPQLGLRLDSLRTGSYLEARATRPPARRKTSA